MAMAPRTNALVLLALLASASASASVAATPGGPAAVLIEPWGLDSVRVRLALGPEGSKVVARGLPGALDESAPHAAETRGAGAPLTSGNIQASYDAAAGLVVTRVSDGAVLARSLYLGVEPCGTVPPQPIPSPPHHHHHPPTHPPTATGIRGGATEADEEAKREDANDGSCAANVQANSDWQHNDILVNGQLHPYDSDSLADCCARCQQWRPLAGTGHCGGFSWAGPNATTGPKNQCYLKYGVGKGLLQTGHFTACVRGVNCTAPPPPPPPPPPAPIPEGCTTKVVARLSWPAGMEAYGTGEHMNTHGIKGRLPSHNLNTSEPLPSANMVGGRWDFESCTVYSDSSGAEICIPWVLAATPGESYEYGMLWNMPNFGSMDLGANETTWVAHDAVNHQIDLFFTTYSAGAEVRGTVRAAKDIMAHYVDATGHSPVMPEWAAGYWHSPMGEPNFNQTMVIDAVDGKSRAAVLCCEWECFIACHVGVFCQLRRHVRPALP